MTLGDLEMRGMFGVFVGTCHERHGIPEAHVFRD